MENSKYTQTQLGAIKKSILLGRTLQKDFPEISRLYRSTVFIKNIVKNLNLEQTYGVNYKLAEQSVINAIYGHNGSLGIEAYDGLISTEELAILSKIHRTKWGKETVVQKIGIFGRSFQQHSADSRRAGKSLLKKGKGIHSLTLEERQEAGRNGASRRGFTVWTDEETEYAYKLSLLPQYHYGKRVNNKLIASEVNNKFHNGKSSRNPNTIYMRLIKYRESLEQRIEE